MCNDIMIHGIIQQAIASMKDDLSLVKTSEAI